MALMPTAQEVYMQTVRELPLMERLRLTALILDDLTQHNLSVVDSSDAWSDQDLHDLTTFSLQYAAATFSEAEERG